MKDDEFYIRVARSLGACQVVEQELKLYITEAFLLVDKCISGKVPFKMSGADCANYSLERLIETFKKLSDNAALIGDLNTFKDERNFLAHNAIARCLDPEGELDASSSETEERLLSIQAKAEKLMHAVHDELNKIRAHLDFDDLTVSRYATGLLRRPLTHAEIEVCIGILEKGAAVNVASARMELPQATSVAITQLDGVIVALGVIKQERSVYAARISERASFAFPPETLELGYVAVDPAHRGHQLSYALVSALIAGRNDALFATTSSEWMMKALSSGCFERQGEEWDGDSSLLSLWWRQPRQTT